MQRTNRGRAFTLVEVLVVVGIVALLMGIVLPTVGRMRSANRQVACASNLRTIGQALTAYAHDNREEYPRIIAEPSDNGDYMAAHEPAADVMSPFANATNGKNASYAALFLLVRSELVKPDVFICPATKDTVDDFQGQDFRRRSNFTNIRATESGEVVATNCSYTYACMYPAKFASIKRMKYGVLPARYPLAADKSLRRCSLFPDDNAGAPGNSRNHQRKGQNVLYADGAVEWHKDPLAGVNGDHIYNRGAGSCNMVPVLDAIDAVIQEP